MNTKKRAQELAKVAQQLGNHLPAYPTLDQIALVAKKIVQQTKCQPISAHQAIVVGVLRAKRQAERGES